MGTETNQKDERNSAEYLGQLIKDKGKLAGFPGVFLHLERLLDEEISKTRENLFPLGTTKEVIDLPAPVGQVKLFSEKLPVPVKEYPEFNFVGRILGPRGMTAKTMEQNTGCKIMVRGRGSMKDKQKEEEMRGKPNWEHLEEDLHVLITTEDTPNRAEIKLKYAVKEVKLLLIPAPEGEDELKKRQLMELAIINGTYRDTKSGGAAMVSAQTGTMPPGALANNSAAAARMMGPPMISAAHQAAQVQAAAMQRMFTQAQAHSTGAPLFITPPPAPAARLPQMPTVSTAGLVNGGPPPLMSPTEAGFLYPSFEYNPYQLTAAAGLLEYQPGMEPTTAAAAAAAAAGGPSAKVRRTVNVREHPYNRVHLT